MRRLTALVIGNAAYSAASTLANPVNDANDIAEKLRDFGFSVIEKSNCTRKEMDRAVKDFKATLAANDVALFFFAGHGMQIEGENYLAAVDIDASDELEAKHSSLALNKVIETMEKGANATSIIVLDACRNNPFERAWTRSAETRGLAPIYAPRGTLIAHATSPGQVASDGKGRNGAYTDALLKHLATPDCTIENMFKRVRNTLSAATGGKQISWEHTSLADEFFFNLSLGARIDAYSDTALSDSLFVLDESKTSHKVIRGLKSQNWPTQNVAIGGFTVADAGKASVDSLFVLGRNLYQAACGTSNSAMSYISDFPSRTSGLAPAKRKAILDGMLFEVFYDPKAKLRKNFKMGQFQELFALEQHRELAESFQFIAECLLPDIGRFYAIPGKKQQVVVDVVTKAGADPVDQILVSVHCAGDDILWLEDDDYKPEPGEAPMRKKLTLTKFEERLGQGMVVASHLLTVNYQSFKKSGSERVHFPDGWTVRRQ
jgi:Caspase domain